MLKLGGASKNLMDMIGEKAKIALMSNKLITKNHSMSIAFDAPENPGTVIDVNAWIVGKKFAMVEKYMKSTYTEVSYKSDYGTAEPQYWELKLKMSSQTSAKNTCEVVQSFFKEVNEINGEGKQLPFVPKVHTLGSNLFIGFHAIIPRNGELDWLNVPEDLI
jgi:hypothetical protein